MDGPDRAVPPFTGVVLCGGRSSRMGRDKALLPVDGVPMARRVADALRAAGAAEVAAAGGDGEALAALGLEVWHDEAPGDGPLPAVIGALRRAGHDPVLVVGCDLVAPDPAAMRATVAGLSGPLGVQGPDVAVPVSHGVRQWHHAAWRRRAAEPLAGARAAGIGSLRRATSALVVAEVAGVAAAALADADAPGDLPGPPGA